MSDDPKGLRRLKFMPSRIPALDAVEVFVSDGIEAVMRRFNADPATAGDNGLPADDAGSEKDSQS